MKKVLTIQLELIINLFLIILLCILVKLRRRRMSELLKDKTRTIADVGQT